MCVCDLETSIMRRARPYLGFCVTVGVGGGEVNNLTVACICSVWVNPRKGMSFWTQASSVYFSKRKDQELPIC